MFCLSFGGALKCFSVSKSGYLGAGVKLYAAVYT
jgi:hypothetical protein